MQKKPLIVRKGQAETLFPLGVGMSFLCPAEGTGRSFSISEGSVPKDAGAPPHHHPWDEAYYILSGEASFVVGEETSRVKAGDFLYVPGGTVHGFTGASEEPARMLIFDAPAASEAFFRELNREVREMPRDVPKIPEIGSKHRITFVK